MKSNKSTKKLLIKAKAPNDISWQNKLGTLKLPVKLSFCINNQTGIDETIKKVTWDWGDGTKGVNVTNKKQPLESAIVTHIFRPKNVEHKTTLQVSVTAYTDSHTIISNPFEIQEALHKESHIYVDPAVFKQQIIDYYKDDKFTDELAESIYLISTRLAFAPNFINYSYRDDMVGDALIKMVEALKGKKFDPDKGNPFSYFTKIAFNAFRNKIKREQRAREAIANYQEDMYGELMGDNNNTNSLHLYDGVE